MKEKEKRDLCLVRFKKEVRLLAHFLKGVGLEEDAQLLKQLGEMAAEGYPIEDMLPVGGSISEEGKQLIASLLEGWGWDIPAPTETSSKVSVGA